MAMGSTNTTMDKHQPKGNTRTITNNQVVSTKTNKALTPINSKVRIKARIIRTDSTVQVTFKEAKERDITDRVETTRILKTDMYKELPKMVNTISKTGSSRLKANQVSRINPDITRPVRVKPLVANQAVLLPKLVQEALMEMANTQGRMHHHAFAKLGPNHRKCQCWPIRLANLLMQQNKKWIRK